MNESRIESLIEALPEQRQPVVETNLVEHTDTGSLPQMVGRQLLGHIAFLVPPSAAVTLTHIIEPGTVSEALAATGAVAGSSLFVACRAFLRQRAAG